MLQVAACTMQLIDTHIPMSAHISPKMVYAIYIHIHIYIYEVGLCVVPGARSQSWAK